MQRGVHRQNQIGARLCGRQNAPPGHGAAAVHTYDAAPILPAQKRVVGLFQPALPDALIHGKPLRLGALPLLGGDGTGKPQRVGQKRPMLPHPHAPRRQAHGAALHQPGAVQRRHGVGIGVLQNGQFARRCGTTKGGKLCFHILAACQGAELFYGLGERCPARGGYLQKHIKDGVVLCQNHAAAIHNFAPRGVLGHGILRGGKFLRLLGVMRRHGKLHPCQPHQKQRKHRRTQYRQHHNAPAALTARGIGLLHAEHTFLITNCLC